MLFTFLPLVIRSFLNLRNWQRVFSYLVPAVAAREDSLQEKPTQEANPAINTSSILGRARVEDQMVATGQAALKYSV
jgi:hypothetical protein